MSDGWMDGWEKCELDDPRVYTLFVHLVINKL